MSALIASSTASESRSQSLDDVVAHLCFVSTEGLHVALRVGERAIPGILGCPDPSGGTIRFYPNDPGDPQALGLDGATRVRLVYGDPSTNYGFRSEIREAAGDGSISIQLPEAIRCTSRRLTSRCLAGSGWSLRATCVGVLGGDRTLELFDLSVSGVGVVFEPSRCTLREGIVFSGVLSIPDRLRLPLRAEVCHIRRKMGSSWLRVAGCRFSGLGYLNHALLAGELALARDRMVANL
jgi:hypothetical protein